MRLGLHQGLGIVSSLETLIVSPYRHMYGLINLSKVGTIQTGSVWSALNSEFVFCFVLNVAPFRSCNVGYKSFCQLNATLHASDDVGSGQQKLMPFIFSFGFRALTIKVFPCIPPPFWSSSALSTSLIMSCYHCHGRRLQLLLVARMVQAGWQAGRVSPCEQHL